MTRLPAWLLVVWPMLLAGGCAWDPFDTTPPAGSPTQAKDPLRDAESARQYNAQAVEQLRAGDLVGAEQSIRSSLVADPFCGPAKNNLGIILLRQRRYYEAGVAFDEAAKFMPDKAEPRNNLGMVFEAVGRLDDAVRAYEEAHRLDPASADITGNLARICVRTHRQDERTRQLLGEVVAKDARPAWVAWARQQLALQPAGAATTEPDIN